MHVQLAEKFCKSFGEKKNAKTLKEHFGGKKLRISMQTFKAKGSK